MGNGDVQLTKQKRRQYTAEFKKEAVELVTKQGYTVAEADRILIFAGTCWTVGGENIFRNSRMPFPAPDINLVNLMN
jgi:hypothetical protein